MKIGKLEFKPVNENKDLVGRPTKEAIEKLNLKDIFAASINPELSDTAAFCDEYDTSMDISVNCVIVEAKRAENSWYAAIMIPANKRADINGIVRKELNARKISFAPMEAAVSLTKMEFGAINPIGLPSEWEILVDSDAAKLDYVVIGSGVRSSKLIIPGSVLTNLPNAKTLNLAKQ